MAVAAEAALKAAIATEHRRVTVLGSTGSVGCNTLDLLTRYPDAFTVEALTAYCNVDELARQARAHNASLAVIGDESRYEDLKRALSGSGIEAAAGSQALVEAAERPAEWVMSGIVGAAGLAPTLAAVRRGAVVALANKECLVCAGDLVMQEVSDSGATLLPVDSEHSAIFQVFDFERPEAVDKIVLTASGGPFRSTTLEAMRTVKPAQALAHPNWDMGAKISIDSATMMNKGLELIEAVHLFPVDSQQVEILIHPQSVVHSMVAYVDGSVLAQLGSPDMRTPIAFALGWPRRIAAPAETLDLVRIGSLTFEAPDLERFPALRLARAALDAGGSAPTILNAANEVAVGNFLEEKIGFLDIVGVVEEVLERADIGPVRGLADMTASDQQARALAEGVIAQLGSKTFVSPTTLDVG